MGIVVIGDVFIDVKGYSTAPFYSRRKKCRRDPADPRRSGKKCGRGYCQYRAEAHICQSGG